MKAGRDRRLLTLTGAALAAIVMTLWGLSELTAPFPHTVSAGCQPSDKVVTRTITRPEVTVSIYNAGAHAGTAGRIGAALTRLGFHLGTVGNAPAGLTVSTSEVVGPSATDPATKLVAAAFGAKVSVSSDPSLRIGPGVNVFIGPKHGPLAKKPPRTMALLTPTVTCLSN